MTENQNIPLLETVDLQKYYKLKSGMLHAVDGISMRVEKGTTLGVVGESGCGKSTLGRTIIGLHKATGGKIYFHGNDITNVDYKKAGLCTKMAMIFQDPYSSLNPRMSVAELITDPMRINHLYSSTAERDQKVEKLMDMVGLAQRVANSYPHELDGGRRQRIGIARALAVNPELIVCDEPVSALDVSIQAQILNLLMDLQDELGLTYIFITHNLSVVKHISTQIMVTYLGKCVETGSSNQIFDNPCHPYTQALLAALPEPSLEARGRKFEILKGEISNPINPRPGCRFASRCPYATSACSEADVEMRETEPGHKSACLRQENA